jgi:hypothetical protein
MEVQFYHSFTVSKLRVYDLEYERSTSTIVAPTPAQISPRINNEPNYNLLQQPTSSKLPLNNPQIDILNSSTNFNSTAANNEYEYISNLLRSDPSFNLLSSSPYNTTLMTQIISPEHALFPQLNTNPSTVLNTIPQGSASVYSRVTAPYDYSKGFHHLIDFVKQKYVRISFSSLHWVLKRMTVYNRMEKKDIMRIMKALADFRPSFLALIMNLYEEDLIFMEKSFQRALIVI